MFKQLAYQAYVDKIRPLLLLKFWKLTFSARKIDLL